MSVEILPTIFKEQITFIKNYFRSEIDKKYNNMFNVTSSEAMNRNERDKTCKQILSSYPSLFRQYNTEIYNEIPICITMYKKHRMYFHKNIFEELMTVVWHPRNFHKFIDWDPDLNP